MGISDINYISRTFCRVCNGIKLTPMLDLGVMPPANAFLTKAELAGGERTFPLTAHFCSNCKLLMLGEVVDPALLFGGYHYLTSASQPLAEHFVKLAGEVAKEYIASKNDLVVEIGSNDGVLLASIKDKCRVLGVDPAENVDKIAAEKGVETLPLFFDSRAASVIKEKYGPAKVVIANNVIAHIDNVRDVFEGIRDLLAPGGVFIFEVHWVGNLLGEGGFDQIYHEHLSYFSLTALRRLIEMSGLALLDAKLVSIHGESLRVYAGSGRGGISDGVKELLRKEKEIGLDKTGTYLNFSEKVHKNRQELKRVIEDIKSRGGHIACYGAPAKGNTLLNFCGLDRRHIDYIADTTPFKQGLFAPGSRVPIFPSEYFRKNPPDYALLLAWNYKDAILEKEKWFGKGGGKWIIPVPEIKII